MPFVLPDVSDADLLALEQRVHDGLRRRSLDDLNVLGFGEIGVAIGLPADDPVAVVKRVPAVRRRSDVEAWFDYLGRYESLVAEHVTVAPTQHRIIETGDGHFAGYLVQPRYPKELLVEHIIADIEPEADHPIVVAVRDASLSASLTGRVAMDPQFTNFVWDDGELVSIDCGSPFMFHADGSPDYEIGAYAASVPAVLRPLVVKLAEKVVVENGSPSGNLGLAALSIVRIGQERWLDDVLACFNERLDDPIDRATVTGHFDKLHGEMQQIKRLSRLQRAWVERVRRGRYEFFITDSFTGDVL